MHHLHAGKLTAVKQEHCIAV